MAVKQIVYFLMAVRIVRALADEETLRAASVSDAVSSSLSLRATSTGELAAEDIDEGVATVNDAEAPESATEDANRSTGGETDSDYAIGESARQRASEPVASSAMLTATGQHCRSRGRSERPAGGPIIIVNGRSTSSQRACARVPTPSALLQSSQ